MPRAESAGHLTTIGVVLFVASGAVGGRLLDVSGGVAAFTAGVLATVAVAAALACGVLVLAGTGRRLRQRAGRTFPDRCRA